MNLLRLANSWERKPRSLVEAPDFIAHLQARLKVSRKAALTVLGDWLTHYSPERVHAIRIIERRPSVAHRRGRKISG